jgi:hypothetical protein
VSEEKNCPVHADELQALDRELRQSKADFQVSQVEMHRYRERYLSLKDEYKLLQGAMNAQDEREKQAGINCGVHYNEHGCDWPFAVAEKLVAAKREIARLRTDVEKTWGLVVDVFDMLGILEHPEECCCGICEWKKRVKEIGKRGVGGGFVEGEK